MIVEAYNPDYSEILVRGGFLPARAEALLPRVATTVLPEVSHHALPHAIPPEANRSLAGFLERSGD
ncbi:hypothetical protein [Streptomyces sp. SP17KL33]|uniref:hypothetical protein n=1 Tax=Streptomyces sp. SP17KL33 TaxID=3002534 RepID=UPI002E762441|nr:hypothetical protein [Streptomyces sp. SP17KL33]MEE1829301.1 hypothetical protein [Streptomyces sp. SP17KL33]